MSTAVILDYSGTICTEAPRLAIPERLDKALEKSGLKDMGLDVFSYWSKVVFPFWEQAKTGKLSLADCIKKALAEGVNHRSSVCAQRFVSIFMSKLFPHKEWVDVLKRFIEKSIKVIIATEHYQEATEAIQTHLIENSILSAIYPHKAQCTIVCSASVGYGKKEREFWDAVKDAAGKSERIIYADDFNLNEAEFVFEKHREKNAHLKEMIHDTSIFLANMGAKEIELFPFVLENIFGNDAELDAELAQRIGAIEKTVLM